MNKYVATAMLAMGSSFFSSCQMTKSQENKRDLLELKTEKGDFSDFSNTVIDEDRSFGDSFYQYGNFKNAFFVKDISTDQFLLYNYDGSFLKEFDRNSVLEVPFEPTSVYIDHDTTYIFYFHHLLVAKHFQDSVKVINLSEDYSGGLTIDKNRLEILKSGNILIPHAVNIFNNLEESMELANQEDISLKNPDYLFNIYSPEGILLKKFGQFPESNVVENPRLLMNSYFYYAIKEDRIFLTFPLGNEIHIFNTDGVLLDKLSVDLPLFDTEVQSNQRGNDCILGIAVDKDAEDEILYLHAVTHLNERKIEHYLYRINLTTKSLVYDEMLKGNNFLLPYTKDGNVLTLKLYMEKEEKELVEYKMN